MTPGLWASCLRLCACAALAAGATPEAASSSTWRGASALRASFHHIHVNDDNPSHLIQYYATLFDRSTTRATAIGDMKGIEAGGVLLLVTPVSRPAEEEGAAGWHFGWGTVALDEAYDRHRMQEIDWELPLESFANDLHVHLESEDPIAAAGWYRERLGARLEMEPANAAVRPVKPIYRRPVAIARLDGVALAIYKAAGPLAPSRGHRIDHIAFTTDLAEARAAPLKVLQPSGRLGPFETMTIEGPDRLAIELVGATTDAPAPDRQGADSQNTAAAAIAGALGVGRSD